MKRFDISAALRNPRIYLACCAFTLLLHILFLSNKTYTVWTDKYKTQSVIENVSSDEYKRWGERGESYIKNTDIDYFGVFPRWTINLFALPYAILTLWGITRFKIKTPYSIRVVARE